MISHVLILDRRTPPEEVQIEGIKYLGLDLMTCSELWKKPFNKVEGCTAAAKFIQSWYDSAEDPQDLRMLLICSNQGVSFAATVGVQTLIHYFKINLLQAIAMAISNRPDLQVTEELLSMLQGFEKKEKVGPSQIPKDFFVGSGTLLVANENYLDDEEFLSNVLSTVPDEIVWQRKVTKNNLLR